MTTTKPGFYEAVTYRYYDEYFNEPDHRLKDEIFEVNYSPDKGIIGWDRSDSIKSRQEMLARLSDSDLVTDESQSVYLARTSQSQKVKHSYNQDKQLAESTYYFMLTGREAKNILNDPRYISKQVKYDYKEGKLSMVAFYAPGSSRPYLLIELAYDDRPGYLKQLPLEARFMPLELPYRDHNITSYTVTDATGNVRKELSYTCEYSYNKDGYPDKFTRRMLNGKEVKGYILYKTDLEKKEKIASVQ
ncbi:hypothetical protein ABID22_001296 [Pontibacter aydingkolensis]|uniref:YD repeat-containing protein n=1 Tax=Pontibacter aydingkolensis TaxID=1911536 RepID=A0ABS7CNN8_9BACT|nr:hypothetical protein [Pontibacter aydingkolensis]MBW7465465.1 hypothetical protein [Pontibacter aydingkolensis]